VFFHAAFSTSAELIIGPQILIWQYEVQSTSYMCSDGSLEEKERSGIRLPILLYIVLIYHFPFSKHLREYIKNIYFRMSRNKREGNDKTEERGRKLKVLSNIFILCG
jgi:hypothetical protein